MVPPLPLKQPPEDPRDLKTRRASLPPPCPRCPTSTTRTTTPPTSTPATRWPRSSRQLELRRQFLCSRRGKERRLGQTRVKARPSLGLHLLSANTGAFTNPPSTNLHQVWWRLIQIYPVFFSSAPKYRIVTKFCLR